MTTVTIPFTLILQCILQQLGLPQATFEEQNNEGPVYTCIVRYHYEDNQGNRFLTFMLGLSNCTPDDARDYACFAALEHLKVVYSLDIVDYNHKELTALKKARKPTEKLTALKASYNELSGQYVSLLRKFQKVCKSLKKIKIVMSSLNYLM